MTSDELNALNLIKTVSKKQNKYSVNNAPYQTVAFLQNFLITKFNINISNEELIRLLDEKCAVEKIREKDIQAKLHKWFGGQCEVITPVGKIDLLTKDMIVEVKTVEHWKHSIGQVIAYGKFYPNHQRCIYLYGKMPKDFNNCYELCEQNNIKLMFESL